MPGSCDPPQPRLQGVAASEIIITRKGSEGQPQTGYLINPASKQGEGDPVN